MMQSNFTIEDPLDGQAVTILVTLPTSDKPKDQRQALVSIGVANEVPVISTGPFGNLEDLLHEAWKQFGVLTEAAKAEAKAKEETAPAAPQKKAETAVAPQLLAKAATTEEAPEPEVEAEMAVETRAPTPKPAPAAPKPAAFLDLF